MANDATLDPALVAKDDLPLPVLLPPLPGGEVPDLGIQRRHP